VLGLLAELPRKNCWTIAEHAGDPSPGGMQHLLARAKWDADGVRDDVRGYVIEHLGDPGAVLVVDETGDVKKGTATPGVHWQYTGTAGRIENAQVAACLGYAAPGGHALIDRELYLPKSWTDDRDRCAAAGIPATVTFATKPQLARRMIERPRARRCRSPGWPGTRSTGTTGRCAPGWRPGASPTCSRPPAITGSPPGPGAPSAPTSWPPACPGRPGSGCPRGPAPMDTIEENFQAGKGLTGLDEHQARRWTSWYRWVTLTMLAAAALTIAAALDHAHGSGPADQIPLTRNQIGHLLSSLTIRPAHDTSHQMRWSRWRRRHQHRARNCHYQRQTTEDQGT
jgi:hypothetical protein